MQGFRLILEEISLPFTHIKRDMLLNTYEKKRTFLKKQIPHSL